MPIIEATLVTKTDMSVAWERKKIAAPVIITLTKPSASGSAAAASEPKTASRISSTIGKPMPRPRRGRPWSGPACRPRAPAGRRGAARRRARRAFPSRVVAQVDGGVGGLVAVALDGQRTTMIDGSRAACASARPRRLRRERDVPTFAAARSTRSTAARMAAASAGRRASTTARSGARRPRSRRGPARPPRDCEPGTPKPPLVRWSV